MWSASHSQGLPRECWETASALAPCDARSMRIPGIFNCTVIACDHFSSPPSRFPSGKPSSLVGSLATLCRSLCSIRRMESCCRRCSGVNACGTPTGRLQAVAVRVVAGVFSPPPPPAASRCRSLPPLQQRQRQQKKQQQQQRLQPCRVWPLDQAWSPSVDLAVRSCQCGAVRCSAECIQAAVVPAPSSLKEPGRLPISDPPAWREATPEPCHDHPPSPLCAVQTVWDTLPQNLFAISIVPYAGFLYHLHRSRQAPPLTLFGFYFLLVFVFATIPAGIYAKSHYGTALANVDWLHGTAESLLTLTNLFVVLGLRGAIRKAEADNAAKAAAAAAATADDSSSQGGGGGLLAAEQQPAAARSE